MIKSPLFPCRIIGRDIVSPDGLVLATVGQLLHSDHAQQLAQMLNDRASQEPTPRIEFKSNVPLGAWIYCDAFGWLVNRSEVLSPEIRLRQGFTHYSIAKEKPSNPPL